MINLHILVILLTMSVPTSPQPPPLLTQPPPPAIPPAAFFTFAHNIPLSLYSSYMCGIFNQPDSVSANSPAQVIYDQRLALLSSWLGSLNSAQPLSPSPPIAAAAFSPFFSSDNKTAILKTLRSKLVSGLSRKQLGQLRAILVQNVTSGDLELASAMTYHAKHNLAMAAAEVAQIFFVQDPSSTAQRLAESDKRKLLAQVILAANGRGPCDDCPLNFQSAEDIVRAVYRNILPPGMTQQQMADAENGMVYLANANFSRQDTENIMANFVHDMMLSDPYQDLKTYRQRSLAHLGRRKRHFYNNTRFDQDAACHALHHYANSSKYCGVRVSAGLVHDRLRCDDDITTTTPMPTSTTTTTTATPSTTSTTTTTTTATPTSTSTTTTPTTTTTIPTTTATPTSTSTTTTPTTTTTVTTTTTAVVTSANDIAVLTLTTPIDLTKICAKAICLNPTYHVTSGQKCEIAGWGLLDENSYTPSDILQSASISTYLGPDCAAAFPNAPAGYMNAPNSQLCAGEPAGGVDTCMGDSGGPLFCHDDVTNKWNLVGVTSYGEGCARPGIPGVYSDVSYFYNWIQQQLTRTL